MYAKIYMFPIFYTMSKVFYVYFFIIFLLTNIFYDNHIKRNGFRLCSVTVTVAVPDDDITFTLVCLQHIQQICMLYTEW